jgi:hypothetical protein
MRLLKSLVLAVAAVMATTAIFGAGISTGTTLEVGGVAKNESVTLEATNTSSVTIKDEFGTTTDSCTFSTIRLTTFGPYTLLDQAGPATWTITPCTHTTTVLKSGWLAIKWTSGTTGTVTSGETEVTVQSTFFGASAVCKTGAGTDLGSFTGVNEGSATIDINAKVNCGILGNATLTGTYKVTSPKGLGVVH